MHNGDECETAGLAAKRSQFVCTVFRIVFLYISDDPVVGPAVKCIEERPKRTTCWSIGNAYVRTYAKRQDHNKDKTQASSDHNTALPFRRRRLTKHHVLRAVADTAASIRGFVLSLVDHTHAAPAEFFDDAVVRDGLADHWREILRP